MSEQRSNGHNVSRLTIHIIWKTKYPYHVLIEDVKILKGVISKDRVHMHSEFLPSKKVSDLVKKLKGRSSRKLQQKFPELHKKYCGRHFWRVRYGCWSTVNLTDKMVNEYLEHHRRKGNADNSGFILK